ncbi:hypothetical protein HUJ04_008883 [Dendroctonus ponderosae]
MYSLYHEKKISARPHRQFQPHLINVLTAVECQAENERVLNSVPNLVFLINNHNNMLYVKSDGTICQEPPILEKFLRLIIGVVAFVIFFFKSLVGMDTSNSKKGSSSSQGGSFFGRFSGGGGKGGGGKPFRPGKPGGGPNIRTMRDINPPTIQGAGGCPGGGCGM